MNISDFDILSILKIRLKTKNTILSEQFGNPIENHRKRQNRYQKHAIERDKIDTKSTQ